jgi:cytochrome c biogenesis protein CcmG, thiol:disulfide interchange protein DsbE
MEIEAPSSGDIQTPGAAKSKSRKRSITIFVVVTLLNVGLLTLLLTQLLTPAQQGTSDPLIGKPAHNFTLAALNANGAPAKMISLADFKGRPVLLNVWNSSCGPCELEAPLLQSAWQEAKDKGVVFLGIDLQDTQSDGLSFLHKYGITYPNAFDANGTVAIDYGTTGIPESIFINRQGVVVSRTYALTAQALQSNLQLITN